MVEALMYQNWFDSNRRLDKVQTSEVTLSMNASEIITEDFTKMDTILRSK